MGKGAEEPVATGGGDAFAALLAGVASEVAQATEALAAEHARLSVEISSREATADAAEATASAEWRTCREMLDVRRTALAQLLTHQTRLQISQ